MVSKEEFAAWTEQAREQYGSNEVPREAPGAQPADVKIADAGVQQSK
jgi:hypothetical protein